MLSKLQGARKACQGPIKKEFGWWNFTFRWIGFKTFRTLKVATITQDNPHAGVDGEEGAVPPL